MKDLIFILLVALIVFIAGYIYFLPSVIAHKRNHHNRKAILVLNLFLGFTLIGWVVSLSWAFTKVEL